MSRAGKFIPGGTGRKTGAIETRTGPIRAPSENPSAEPPSKGGKRLFPKGSSLIKPVPKGRRIPIVIMSSIVCCLLVSFAWYQFAVVPVKREMLAAQAATDATKKQLAEALAAQQTQDDARKKHESTVRATVMIDSNPQGAAVTIGDSHQNTPATFTDIIPGKINVLIQSPGYSDYQQEATVTAEKAVDLGTVQLVAQVGNLSITSADSGVNYVLTGPGDFKREGQVPDKLSKLPVGDYQLSASEGDWKLAPEIVTIHDQENVLKEIKFPFADLSITSTPSGATVRNGRVVLGKTPMTMSHLRPGNMVLSVDLPPYSIRRFEVSVPTSGNISKAVTLPQEKDFISASGMPMVWIPDGDFWAGKYEVTQSAFERVTGFNPSSFRRPTRPVETLTWEAANTFCDKLNQFERKAGKLPEGYHYALPTESQWSTYSADADIEQAVMSRRNSLSSTMDVGSSEPNKYGLYDTLGNVWEWCSDLYDDHGDHSLRGGSWLSSADNFPSADTRSAGAPKYADRFTGFRVVLVPN